MNRHPLQWVPPSPLWARFAPAGATPGSGATVSADDQFRPTILRFANDDFMDRLLAILARDPKKLADTIARPETWRTPADGGPELVEQVAPPRFATALRRLKAAREPKPVVAAVADKVTKREQALDREVTLKLYQPAHQRYYLVAADLVCAAAGFPKHALATGGREQVGFVIRRLLPQSPGATTTPVEHGFLKDAAGARWQPVDGRTLLPGEELLPLFPMNFHDDTGLPRRMLAGLIPVGRREEYMTTGRARAGAGDEGTANTSSVSGHKEHLKMEVAEPWKNLVRNAYTSARSINDAAAEKPPGATSLAALRIEQAQAMNLQLQMQSWLVLLDFASYLAAHLPAVWSAIQAGNDSALDPSGPAAKLYDWLGTATISTKLRDILVPAATQKRVAPSLRDALRDIARTKTRDGLEAAQVVYAKTNALDDQWPDFQFPLAGINSDLEIDGPFAALGGQGASDPPAGERDADVGPFGPNAKTDLLDRLVVLVTRAIGPDAAAAPPLPFAATLQRALVDIADDAGWFVIRCIHVRCDCGPLRPVVASAPTQRFQLAGFFDPDAPARPIRIALPLDTTPAGLRKFNKNTALVVSDVLCGQIARAKGLGLVDLVRAVLPWPLHKDLEIGEMGPCKSGSASIGMICSLSIPIVTICALILLMIIVSILDYIFRWMPYLIMCFPVPGLKAKKPEGGP